MRLAGLLLVSLAACTGIALGFAPSPATFHRGLRSVGRARWSTRSLRRPCASVKADSQGEGQGACPQSGTAQLSRKDFLGVSVMAAILAGAQTGRKLAKWSVLREIALLPEYKFRADANAEPGPEFEVRELGLQDRDGFVKLTEDANWDDTVFDIELLLKNEATKSFGAFTKEGLLVSMSTVTYMPKSTPQIPGGGKETLWLSYVTTLQDYRRMGLAKKVCKACIDFSDKKYPGVPLGLYGEAEKAGPLYEKLGFTDMGAIFGWNVKVDPADVLRGDENVQSKGGMLEVPAAVERIIVGSTTAVAMRGKELLDLALMEDAKVYGGSREVALRAWGKSFPEMCWVVKDVDKRKVKEIFDKFAEGSGEPKRLTLQGFQSLSKATEGTEVTKQEFDGFCVRSGSDPKEGFTVASLAVLYSLSGNDVDKDYSKIFGNELPSAPAGLRGYVFGRTTTKGFFLGPIVANDQECAAALFLASVRGGCVIHLGQGKTEKAFFELLTPEGGGKEAKLSEMKAPVIAGLGFAPFTRSRFMVRNGDPNSFYGGDFDRVYGVAAFEFA